MNEDILVRAYKELSELSNNFKLYRKELSQMVDKLKASNETDENFIEECKSKISELTKRVNELEKQIVVNNDNSTALPKVSALSSNLVSNKPATPEQVLKLIDNYLNNKCRRYIDLYRNKKIDRNSLAQKLKVDLAALISRVHIGPNQIMKIIDNYKRGKIKVDLSENFELWLTLNSTRNLFTNT